MYISPLAVEEMICAAVCVGERIDGAGWVFLECSECWGVHPGDQLCCPPPVLGAELFGDVTPMKALGKPDPCRE